MKKKILSILLAAIMIVGILPTVAFANPATHDLTVTKNNGGTVTEGTDYEWNATEYGNKLIIKASGLTVSGTTTTEFIDVDASVTDLTINDLSITSTLYDPILFNVSGDATLTLVGSSSLTKDGYGYAIQFIGNGTIAGTGSVTASSLGGAGIKGVALTFNQTGTVTASSMLEAGIMGTALTFNNGIGRILARSAYTTYGAVYGAVTLGDALTMKGSTAYNTEEANITGETTIEGNTVKTSDQVALSVLIEGAASGGTTYSVTNGTAEGDKETNHGYITVNGTAAEGDPVTITVNPANGYQLKSLTVTPEAPAIAGALKGEFGVSADKKVYFSQGNLVATIDATGAPTAWKFSAHQYDCLGAGGANKTIGATAGDIDLFGWSTDASSNNWGVHTKTTTTDGFTSGNFNDWGKNMGDGNTWRTLSGDEWTYLFNTRTASTVSGTATARYAKATVNSKAGVILLPDTYAHPEGVTALTNINTAGTAFTANEYDSTDWGKMESAGAVFLPAAGYRNGSNVYDVGVSGSYWSSTASGSSGAHRLYFKSDNVSPSANGNRYFGYGVRLVTSAPAAPETITPAKQLDGIYQFTMPAANVTVTAEFELAPAPVYYGGGSTPTVTVPVSGDGNSVKVSASVSGSTATVKDIKDADLAKVVDAEAVEIDLSGLNKNIDTAKIPTTTVEKIGEQAGMSVKLSTATVTFDQTATQEISDQAKGNTVELVVDDVKEVSLNAVQKEAVKKLDTALIIDAHLVSNGTRLCSESKGGFGGGKATVILPYEIKNNRTPANYSVFYVDDAGKLQKLNAVYDKELAAFVFEIEHFSVYAVAYDENGMPFTDVAAGEYFYDAVKWAVASGITDGTDATHFSPGAPVTRAQVVTFLWRAAGKPVVNYYMNMSDVKSGEYYSEAVRWALSEGITKGTSDTTFSPDKVCTRGQIVTFLARFAGVKDEATGYTHGFTDVKATDYFNNAVAWAKDNKVTEGTSATTFSPNTDCTRAQVVTFLYRWMVK